MQYTEYPSSDEVLDMKENDQLELFNLCKAAFESEKSTFNKRRSFCKYIYKRILKY